MNKVEQLRKCLQKARAELNAKGYKYIPGESKLMDCKPFGIAYRDCIENIWPDVVWWKVTNYWDIFDAMMGGLSDEEVIDEICKHIDSDYLKEDFSDAKVEEGHTLEEYMREFGRLYKDGQLWDFSEEDFKGGAIEINPEITYWKIEVDGEPRYFETISKQDAISFEAEWGIGECKESCHKEKKSLDEGTSNFGSSEYFPLLVFYTYDDVYSMMNYDSNKPEEADFEDEDGNVDEDAYWKAKEEFEQKFLDNLDCCVLDEDEVERLKDKLFEFNSETEKIADERWHEDISEDRYNDLSNLEDVKLEVAPGYYEAAYINVDNENALDYMTEEFKQEQIKRITDFIRELKKEFGLSEYKVAWGPASNGETGYQKVKDDEVDENMYDGKKGGNKGSVKTKVHVNKNAGDPKRNMEIFNHMMGSDAPAVSTGVALGESEEGVARVEYCLMSDGDNVDCYGDEADAIANAKEFKDECAKRGMSNVVRVLLVKYGPKDEHGDEPELSAEEIWPDNPSFEDDDSRDEKTNKEAAKVADESLNEDLDLPKEVTFKASEVALDTDDEDPEERLSDLLSDKYGFCHYGFKYEVKNNENGEPSEFRCYDIEWDTSESLKEEKEYLSDKVTQVLDDYGILYGDIVENGDGTVNIVGVDEEEWDEVVEAIKSELGLDVLVPDSDHGEFDDELIVRECLKEATEEEIWDEEDITKHKETDWKARNWEDLDVGDEFKGKVYIYRWGKEPEVKEATFHKFIRANDTFPPYYKAVDFEPEGVVGPMFDGRRHGNYDIHDRYEDQKTYDLLSEARSQFAKK